MFTIKLYNNYKMFYKSHKKVQLHLSLNILLPYALTPETKLMHTASL